MKKTLLTIGVFAVIGMASTGVAVVWFGETQLPRRECSEAEAVQKKVLTDRFYQDFKTNTFRSHEPLPFCYEEGKRITTAEWYAELGKEIEQTPSPFAWLLADVFVCVWRFRLLLMGHI